MIDTISVKNFISYEKAEVPFEGATSIAVVGDNGCGKSALLETIPYALFGISRYRYASELARLGGDGTFSVMLRMTTPTPGGNDVLEIERGLKSKGFVRVRLNGELVAKGSEANTYIENVVGMNAETFMLIAFYGLGDNKKADQLLKVEPSVCLETLQKIANVHIYTKLNKAAKQEKAAVEIEIDRIKARLEGYNATYEDPVKIQKRLNAAKKESDRIAIELGKAKKERDDLVAEENKSIAFVTERDGLEEQISDKEYEIADLKNTLADLNETLQELREESSDTASNMKEVKEALKGVDESKLQERLEDLGHGIGRKNMMKELKAIAANIKVEDATCPLCGSAIEKAKLRQWSDDLAILEEEMEVLADEHDEVATAIKKFQGNSRLLVQLVKDQERLKGSHETNNNRVKESKKKLTVKKGELETLKVRLTTLYSELGAEYDTLSDKINEVSERVEDLTREIGEVSSDKKSLTTLISTNRDLKKKMSTDESRLKACKTKVRAYELLVEAFSRYGIPLMLLKNLVEAIEERATDLYSEFGNGQIVIEEMEGAKPGLRFMLSDRKGVRPFVGLSLGEQAMFFVAVRVAISQIVAGSHDIGLNFLVLDEGMANLSPANRDNLLRLINKVLRRIFNQVLMVSHIEINDIFSKTIECRVDNDVTEINVR